MLFSFTKRLLKIAGIFALSLIFFFSAIAAVPKTSSSNASQRLISAFRKTKHLFEIVSESPSNSSQNVDIESPITLTFSDPLGQITTYPSLTPPINGTWVKTAPNQLTFVPEAPGTYSGTETVTINASINDIYGEALQDPQSFSFTYQQGPVLRLQQLLSILGYMPVSFTPVETSTTLLSLPYSAQGSFSWKYPSLEPYLANYFSPGQFDLVTRAAVMTFEAANNLAVDGVVGPIVWSRLFYDYLSNKVDPYPYYFVIVNMNLPERLYDYVNGNMAFSTLVNTGIAVAPTQPGLFPIYARYVSTTMSGRNPDGTYYHDTGVPWVSYFNGGDALHGFMRPGYGYPQSLGCVEMTYSSAQQVFNLTTYGTIVDVIP